VLNRSNKALIALIFRNLEMISQFLIPAFRINRSKPQLKHRVATRKQKSGVLPAALPKGEAIPEGLPRAQVSTGYADALVVSDMLRPGRRFRLFRRYANSTMF
jgi:hypothetical protein